MVAWVSFGPSGKLMPKSATFADSGALPASLHTSVLLVKRSLLLLLLPGVGLAVSSTLPAFRSP